MNMEDLTEKKEGNENYDRQDIYSNVVRAGKRTYFFDVKATRRNDYYLTLTESKKRFSHDGKPYFEKHKIFLYKEDFEKFTEGLEDVIRYIKKANPVILDPDEKPVQAATKDEQAKQEEKNKELNTSGEYTNVEFDDLGEKTEE